MNEFVNRIARYPNPHRRRTGGRCPLWDLAHDAGQ